MNDRIVDKACFAFVILFVRTRLDHKRAVPSRFIRKAIPWKCVEIRDYVILMSGATKNLF